MVINLVFIISHNFTLDVTGGCEWKSPDSLTRYFRLSRLQKSLKQESETLEFTSLKISKLS